MKKLIVTMTSWNKRIQYVSKTIYMMETQTIKPDLIVLNLAEEEFTNKEKDLPEDLITLNKCLDNFEIYWVKENTRAFKKAIPTIERFKNEDCWIVSVDDDMLYRQDFLQFMVETAEKNPNKFLTPHLWPHGYMMIYNPIWFKDEKIWKITRENCDKIIASDAWNWEALKHNGIDCLNVPQMRNLVKDLNRPNKLGSVYCNMPQDVRMKLTKKIYEELT